MSTEPHPRRTAEAEQPAAALVERLVRERGPHLRRIAASIAGTSQAEDAVQSACLGFLRSYEPATAYAGVDGAFSYLATATAHAAMRLRGAESRRLAALRPVSPIEGESDSLDRAPSEAAGPLELVVRREEFDDARGMLPQLPADWRRVLLARAAGFDPQEIQAEAGLTSRQYRKRIEKANRRLGAMRDAGDRQEPISE